MTRATPETVLVIDDEPAIVQLIAARLGRWGYRIVTAANGRQGIERLAESRPDLVLTDLFMPEMDGFAVLAHLERTDPDLPVIVLSGQGTLGDAIRAMRQGAWDYIFKPIEEFDFLRLTIDGVLEKARLIKENRDYHDHLERMLAQQHAALVASERRYRTVADFTYDWEYWIDPTGAIVYMSPSCERVTGYPAQAFRQDPSLLNTIVHADDREVVETHQENRGGLGEACQLDFRIVRRDGTSRWISHICQSVRDADGNDLGRRCSNRDITYRKQIETDLRAKQNELREKTTNLKKANDALKSLLDQRQIEKRSIEQSMVANLKRFVFPYLNRLSQMDIGKEAATYLDIVRTNIEQLVSPVSKTLGGAYLSFTPAEVKVADLIRQGHSTRDIAALLHTSTSTVAIHRNNIRKKLGLRNRKVNLHTYLNSLV